MSASNIKDILSSRRRMVAAAAWMLVLVVALSAATYAWFSSSRYTNVTPVAHTVSDESSDLQTWPFGQRTLGHDGHTCRRRQDALSHLDGRSFPLLARHVPKRRGYYD